MATFISMATCHTCNKMSRYNGVNRDFMVAFAKTRGTPGSNGKHRTPQAVNRSTPKSVGKEKTPSRTPSRTPSKTPRSASSGTPGSGSSSSSKSTSGVKKWVVQRLSKILHRDHKPDSKKGTLKDFLSSL